MLDQHQSPLFRLAAELHDAIYTMELTADGPIVDPVRNTKTPEGTRGPNPPLGAALMRTCKRIYTETNPDVLYRNNTFTFTNPYRGIIFLRQLPVAQRSMIHKDSKSVATVITFDLTVLQQKSSIKVFRVFHGLQDRLFNGFRCENTLDFVGMNSAGDVVKVAGITKTGNISLAGREYMKNIMDKGTGRFKVGIGNAV